MMIVENKKNIYYEVDKPPVYKDGISDVLTFFARNVKPVPISLSQNRIDLQFIVSSDGKVYSGGIYNKKELDYSPVEKEYLRALSTMPRWEAGKCGGKKVDVKMRLPILLELNM
ncbi:hypothetical protein ABDJ41_10785 [Pedobacter sp. ASV1-7]|uniref:hypothetical protein n=1 Tax=Pedobacter sp. ASV1-7 TaxID=3145237 RepID=UPI0032E87F29